MKNLCSCILFFVLLTAGLVTAQKPERQLPKRPSFHEEIRASSRPIEAPPECIQQVRLFIQYVTRGRPDISTDAPAQQRFLSELMRKAFANRRAVYAEYVKKNDTPDLPPDSGSFLGAWDPPTSFRIVGSRRYGKNAVVDVLFTWGKNTNYEGDTRLTSYCLVREKGSWKLDDVYIFNGEFIGARSLIEYFRRETY